MSSSYNKRSIYVTAEAPVAIELTPLLGVLAGVVASLILLALGIVLVLRLRGRDCDEKQQKTIIATDLKRSNESMDSLEKNPDIIPHNNGISCSIIVVNLSFWYCTTNFLCIYSTCVEQILLIYG